jgi:polyisoprenoid-binding protein YceI
MKSPGFRIAALLLAVAAAGLVAGVGLVAAAGSEAPGTYSAEPVRSRLEFYGKQAGAEFQGVFHRFTAVIEFSPDALATAHFDVQIDLGSLDSQDNDRDSTMRSADIFDIGHFPTAHYVTRGFTKTAAGFRALGALTLRGVTKDVPVDFQFAATPGGAKLDGTASLNRLDFGVGQGDWKSTESVDNAVRVKFSLALAPKP